MNLDWGRGDYSLTGRQLESVAVSVVSAAQLRQGERALDVGCGDGNAALAAARHGASVSGIDPSPRLVRAARERAASLGLSASFAVGEAAAIDAPDGAFSVVFAIFSVIFADDAPAATAEMVRVTRPGGRLFITSWVPGGAIDEVTQLLVPRDSPPPPSPWHSIDGIRSLFAALPVELELEEASWTLEAPSAESCFRSWEAHHPFWLQMRGLHADWEALAARCIERLEAHNEASEGFRVSSRYRVIEARRSG